MRRLTLPVHFAVPALVFALGATALIRAEPPMGPDPDWIPLPECESTRPDTSGCGHRLSLSFRREADGTVARIVRGRKLGRMALRQKLLLFSERSRDEDGWSDVRLLIRAPRDLPFGEIREVFDLCLDPDVRIWRIEFAVYPPNR